MCVLDISNGALSKWLNKAKAVESTLLQTILNRCYCYSVVIFVVVNVAR